jgi:opacity protein-like surface antigen
MKKMISLSLFLLLSIFASAETIDGTLAVDSNSANNALTQAKQTSQAQLSANLDNNDYTAKSIQEPATSDVVPTNSSNSSFLEGPFVGIEGSAIFASEAEGKSNSGMSLGLRFGAQNIEWRTMAILEKFGSDDDYNNYIRGLLQIDYYFLGMDNLMIDSYALRPYAGINAGAMSLDTETENIKSLVYGGQIGATMNVTQNIDLDVGYRYSLSSSDKIDHTSGIAIGLHYKY